MTRARIVWRDAICFVATCIYIIQCDREEDDEPRDTVVSYEASKKINLGTLPSHGFHQLFDTTTDDVHDDGSETLNSRNSSIDQITGITAYSCDTLPGSVETPQF